MSIFSLARQVALWLLLSTLPAMAATPPTITLFPIDITEGPSSITGGPDGNLWVALGNGTIGRVTPQGAISEFQQGLAGVTPYYITAGADGNLWFEFLEFTAALGKITPTGAITKVTTPNEFNLWQFSQPLASGPDGNVWFANPANPSLSIAASIGRVTPAGTVTEFTQGLDINTAPISIAAGPDGNMWFVDRGASAIGRITLDGSITEFSQGLPGIATLLNIAPGTDGNIWFTEGPTAGVGRITPQGVITNFTQGFTVFSQLEGIVNGPDGNVWFVDNAGGVTPAIGRITQAGVVTEFPLVQDTVPHYITVGPDGALWFTSCCSTYTGVERLTVPTDALSVSLDGLGGGQVTSALAPGVTASPGAVMCVSGGDSGPCTASFADSTVVTLTATAAPHSVFAGWSGPGAVAGHCDGTAPCQVPLSVNQDSQVTARFVPDVKTAMLSLSGNGTVTSFPSGIACGQTCTASFATGTLVTLAATPAPGYSFVGWSGGACSGIMACTFVVNADTAIDAGFAPDSASDIILVSALLPTSRSVQVGTPATVFGTVINASRDTAASDCSVSLATQIPANFSFQTTDPATNDLTGLPNEVVGLVPGGSQSFLLSLTPTAPFDPTDVAFDFSCANAPAATSSSGLNTLLLSASTVPTPDIVALAATVENNGIVEITGPARTGAFAVATANVGSLGVITASADVGAANLPVAVSICETEPLSGACLGAPASSVVVTIQSGAEPSFAVFVQASASVSFQPAANRVFVRFKDANGSVRGSTSVAVRTQ